MTTFDRVCAVMDKHSIPYAVIGAAALASYGIARSTFDIDLLVTDPRALDPHMWHALAADVRRGDVEDPLAGVVRVVEDGERPVDVVVGKHPWQARAVARARRAGAHAPVVQARDFVLLKLYAGGAQDLWDVREVLAHSVPSLVEDVSEDVAALSPELRQRWASLRTSV